MSDHDVADADHDDEPKKADDAPADDVIFTPPSTVDTHDVKENAPPPPPSPTEGSIPFEMWARGQGIAPSFWAGMRAFTTTKLATPEAWTEIFSNY